MKGHKMANEIKRDIELGLNRLEWGDSGRAQRAVLTIDTGKAYSGGVESSASVHWLGGGGRVHAFGLGVRGDYRKTLCRSDRTVKATQKAIDRQYAEVFTDAAVAVLVAEARAHYPALVVTVTEVK